jgi:hypothetical protein
VTEIPEHLLKRSRERRQAMGLPGGDAPDGGSAGPAPAAPSTAVAKKAAAPAAAPKPAKPAPKPVPAYVKAAERRRKIPFWAAPVVGLLPLWAFLYYGSMQTPEAKVTGPLADGAKVYNSCASCHGGGGEGGVGYPFVNGSAYKTFPNIEDMLNFVWHGSEAYVSKGSYGDPAVGRKPLGRGVMPGQNKAGLTDAEILAVVCHERFVLAGKEQSGAEWDKWCSPAAENYVKVKDGGFAAVGIDTSKV